MHRHEHKYTFVRWPGESAFEALRSQIYRVETASSNGRAVASAFAVARFQRSNRLVIATAGHVLTVPNDEEVEWSVQRLGTDGYPEAEARFTTHGGNNDCPYRYHKKLDVGICVLPAASTAGTLFARPDEHGLVSAPGHLGVTAATRVAWAGYPSQVEQNVGFPQLCYFEGVVSATVDARGKCLYVVDGHAAPGVSGGPVWHWSEERSMPEVVGIVSTYASSQERIPGFLMFEPINPVILHIRSWSEGEA
jgi:hypothetical protein